MADAVRPADARHQGARGGHGIRSDVQGLRAVAVVAVILDHVFGRPSGGFVGVDVFFVVSGFLITGLLLRELETTGGISLLGFYARRVKRILPAALLVIVVTVATAFLVFNSSRAEQTVTDGLWSLLFSANWHFALVGTDYFAAGGPVSPLQHYWSLGVEEQFYLVWPWMLTLTLTVAARRTVSASRAAIALVVVLGGASLAWALWESRTAPTWAYFSTFSRAWELGVGALVAGSAGRLARIPVALRPALGWVGLAGVVISLFAVRGDQGFPAPGVMLPVLATALVLLAGIGFEQRSLVPLTNRASAYVGDISFSLYLWHWPVLVLLASLIPSGTAFYYSVVLVITLGLSVATFHLVEDPVRRSRLFTRADTRADARLDRTRRAPFGRATGPAAVLLATATFAALVAVVVLAVSR